jgi:hypothetical protein
MTADQLLLQAGTCLLHIGPHKTGTTAVQGALHLARERLTDQGVVYAGHQRQSLLAALAVTGRPALLGGPSPDMTYWNALIRDVRAAGDHRVVVSSEFFADAGVAQTGEIIKDLGGPRVHVVVTLRSLARIMPSQWQQYLQNGFRMPYLEWLEGILSQPPRTPTPGFWHRHRHDQLIARWAKAVGTKNLTVIVLNESDRMMLLRTFESLLGLPDLFLIPEDGLANRSLTFAEAEVVRLLNEEFKRQEWPARHYARFMRYGAVEQLKTAHQPLPDEPKITTPAWALRRAAEIGAEMAGNISALGVRIVGDLSSLSQLPAELAPAEDDPGPGSPPLVPAQGGASAISGQTAVPTISAPDATPAGLVHDVAPASKVQDAVSAISAQVAAPLIPAHAAVQAVVGAFIAGRVANSPTEETLRDVDAKTLARTLAKRGRKRMRQTLLLQRPDAQTQHSPAAAAHRSLIEVDWPAGPDQLDRAVWPNPPAAADVARTSAQTPTSGPPASLRP